MALHKNQENGIVHIQCTQKVRKKIPIGLQ